MQEQIQHQRNHERVLKRKMEDLHFANMVQYENQLKSDMNLLERKSSAPSKRMAQTIDHQANGEHSTSI